MFSISSHQHLFPSSTSQIRPESLCGRGPESEYEWRIENFSMCPRSKGHALYSTSFTVDSLDQSEFRLVLYPRGLDDDDVENITCFLECITQSDYNISVVLSVLGSDGTAVKTKTKHCFILSTGGRVDFRPFPSRKEFMARKRDVLPEDVFTVKCVIVPEYRASFVCDEDFLEISKDYKNLLRSGKYSDFVINTTGGEKCFVHKIILIIRSQGLAKRLRLLDDTPVSQAMCTIKPPMLKTILEYMYTGKLKDDLHPDELNELYEAAKLWGMDDLKRDLCPLETRTVACTIVRVDHRTISWTLKDFHQRIDSGDWPMRTFVDLTLGRFVISFSVKRNCEGKYVTPIEIYAQSLMVDDCIFVKCKVLVDRGEGGPKDELCSGKHWFIRDNDETRSFSMSGDHDVLYAWRSLRRYPEKISLVVEFGLSNSGSSSKCRKLEVENTLEPHNPAFNRSYQRLSSDLDIVFRDTISEKESDSDLEPGTCSDLRIRSKSGKLIFAHRCILAARSFKFRQLIDSIERKQAILDLADISDETLQDLLRYLYSGKVKNRDLRQFVDLYIAARKYIVPGLVKRCSHLMQAKMTTSDVYSLLILADENEDEYLFSLVLHYICLNRSATLSSSAWKDIVTQRPALASETLKILSTLLN